MRSGDRRKSEPGHRGLVATYIPVGHGGGEARHRSAVERLASHHVAVQQMERLVELEGVGARLDGVEDLGSAGRKDLGSSA